MTLELNQPCMPHKERRDVLSLCARDDCIGDHDSFPLAANYQPYVSCTIRSKDDLSVAVYLSYLDKTKPQVSHDDILPSKGPL